MRKTIIALILVIPMVFVLVVFSSVKFAALSVDISANGIRIHADNVEEGTLYVNISEPREYIVTAEVMPENAKNKGYKLTSDDPSVADVTAEGKLILSGEGTATITATSDDKGYTDSLSVVVAASEPYDVAVSLLDAEGNDLLTETAEGYSAAVETGSYHYSVAIRPAGFMEYTLTANGGTTAVIDEGERSILLPFSGEASFTVSVPDGRGGAIEKNISLDVAPQSSRTGILVDGMPDGSAVVLGEGTKSAVLYVESNERPVFTSDYATATVTAIASRKYRLNVTISDDFDGERFPATITAGGKSAEVTFSFAEFDYHIVSDLAIETENGVMSTAVIVGNSYRFYAVSTVTGGDVTYEWEAVGAPEHTLTTGESTSYCTIRASETGEFRLRVRAMRAGEPILDAREIVIHAVENIGAVRVTNKLDVDLAENYTVAGYAYDENLTLMREKYVLNVYTFTPGKPLAAGGDELVYSVSDPTVATIDTAGGTVGILPVGTGEVTVTVEWRWNGIFGKTLRASLRLNVISDAVSVKNAPEYTKAMEEGRIAVLKNDISLGTDRNGAVLDIGVREQVLAQNRMKSTYNIDWYKHTDLVQDETLSEADAYISYVSEITNDIYGNGFSLDADAFTHAVDGNDQPMLKNYRGPLYFVKYRQLASVAGQDNCAFLIRKNGIKLYGVNLLGCKDESLLSDAGGYDLTNLNLVGTTLEVNADCDIVNCRIRNGRNVVRAYGGNRDGEHYFIDSLRENTGCDSERIHVRIEGCVLSQGREFILKIGANRALRASPENGAEPYLLDQSGQPYAVNGAANWYELLGDDYFYQNYVLTDVTLKDSVLETSGFFTVGIESNFAGDYLYTGGENYHNMTGSWQYSGGTSFASVLRLEGDVRLYDWKDISLVDSSTLIESPTGALQEWLKLDVAKMLDFVYHTDTATYGNVFDEKDGKQFVHGGIAFYGGGRNYSQLDTSALDGQYTDFVHYQINIGVLKGSDDDSMQNQGKLLPNAAGKNDFNFFMYSAGGTSDYDAQLRDESNGEKYKGIKPVPAF